MKKHGAILLALLSLLLSLLSLLSYIPLSSLPRPILHLSIVREDQKEDSNAALFPSYHCCRCCRCLFSLPLSPSPLFSTSSTSSTSSTLPTPSSALLSQKRLLVLRRSSPSCRPWYPCQPVIDLILACSCVVLPPPPSIPSLCGRRRRTVTSFLLSFPYCH